MTGRQYCIRLMVPFAAFLSLSGCWWFGWGRDNEHVLAVGQPGPALRCAEAAALPSDTAIIGPEGGELSVGNNELEIPPDALTTSVQLVFSRLPGDSAVVEVDREVRFDNEKSATLVIDLNGCDAIALDSREWFVWRLHPRIRSQSQKLHTKFEIDRTLRGGQATVLIDSTSVFMIAN